MRHRSSSNWQRPEVLGGKPEPSWKWSFRRKTSVGPNSVQLARAGKIELCKDEKMILDSLVQISYVSYFLGLHSFFPKNY